ncbi:MAG: energy transducer TonB [Thermodesulfobacteriota bacterium]|nr:energy transducer TonB [Thermodesulfobacteriota bacterium]
MKRIFLAAIISLGLHGLLFSMETEWFAEINAAMPESHQITISLVHRLPKKPEIKPSVKHKPKYVRKKKPLQKNIKPSAIEKKETSNEAKSRPDPEKPEPAKPTKELFSDHTPEPSPVISSAPTDHQAVIHTSQSLLEAKPMYRVNPPPLYPLIARKRGYQGHVILEALINQQGKVIDIRVFSSSGHSILDKAAMASVKKWSFQPGMLGTEKIEMWVRVPIRFRLN